MCQACEEAETFFIPYFGKPGGWRPPAPPAQDTPAPDAPAEGERTPKGEPSRFACDGPTTE
jgi:hypothetical protein